MWSWHDGGWGWGGWFMLLMMVIIVVGVVVAIVFLVRGLSSRPTAQASSQAASPPVTQGPERGETPREILQRRYAAGEIEREEYLQKLRDLNP